MEYECYHLDPNTKMSHVLGEPLLRTSNLGEALTFIHLLFENEQIEGCVWSERSQGYAGYCRAVQARNKRGQFSKKRLNHKQYVNICGIGESTQESPYS